MSLPRGPLRIVLLRSAGYDYAELELHEPLHLVAANNVGKTSLIAALQFLYIDDARYMHFSHDWGKTRQHYFPGSGSFVLFQCMTPTGFQVFGLRGLGPVQGFDYQRFAYSGAYDRADYLDGRNPRPWAEVARRLVDRDLRVMEPKHLRASLTGGAGDTNGPPLGLVPLKRSGSYENFRFLFRNLLRLSKVEQDQLKQLFIDISGPRLRETKIDLRSKYHELFSRAVSEAQNVQALQQVAPTISRLVDHFEQRRALRVRIAGLWSSIESSLKAKQAAVLESIVSLDRERERLEAELEGLQLEHETARKAGSEIAQEQGSHGATLTALEELRERTKLYVPELENMMRQGLQSKYEALVARISIATRADRKEVERSLHALRKEIASDQKLVEQFSDALVTWLRARSGLSEGDLGDLFDLLDPALLGEVLDEGRISIVDEASAVALVRRIHECFDTQGFYAEGVRVRRRASGTPSQLDEYRDVDAIKVRLARAKERERELDQRLADINAREALIREQKKTQDDLEAAAARLRDWESWVTREPELQEVKKRLATLSREAEENTARQKRLQARQTEIAVSLDKKKRTVDDLQSDLDRLVSAVHRLEPAPSDWDVEASDTSAEAPPLEELIRTYQSDFETQRGLSRRVEHLMAEVEQKTASRYVGAGEIETIKQLKDELTALQERERAVQDLWTSLVDGMRNAFKSLVQGVDEIRSQVTKLTSALGQHQVSNLERVELELVRQHDLIRKLEAVIEVDDMPLFVGPGGRDRAAKEIRSWLEDRQHIDLAELFDLRFKVVDVKGQSKVFDSLAQIESQGTSTTIKVLVHLELLRAMLTGDTVSVPFFLDEVATLDEANLRALIDHATGMRFVPVIASPEARDCVETLYFLRPGPGALVLDETSRVRLRRKRGHAP